MAHVNDEKANIVIVGGGVAGMEITTQLGNSLGRCEKASITLVDKDSSHIWKPILHKIAAGTNDLSQQQVSFVGSCANDFNIPGISQYCYFVDSRIQARIFNRLVRMHHLFP